MHSSAVYPRAATIFFNIRPVRAAERQTRQRLPLNCWWRASCGGATFCLGGGGRIINSGKGDEAETEAEEGKEARWRSKLSFR